MKRIYLARLLILVGVVLLALAAVIGRRLATQPTLEERRLGPGKRLRVPIDTGSGPTEESPQVRLHLVITDASTGAPVLATVLLDSQVVAEEVAEFEVRLPGHLVNEPVTIRVEAPGYKVWEVEAKWNVERSRKLRVPVKLEKLNPQT